MRLLIPTLLLLSTACAADTEYTPLGNCEEGSCDEQKLELVEFCRVDVGLTWDCEDIDASVSLCDYDGNYRIGGGVVQIDETDGAVCTFNGLSFCHDLHVSASGDHMVCEVGTVDILVDFNGVPLREGGLELCGQLDHWEGYNGYFHDRKFGIGKEGATCRITGEAFDLPDDEITCHDVVISQEGMTCTVGDFGEPTLYPFVK
jgi:hypothetical protein